MRQYVIVGLLAAAASPLFAQSQPVVPSAPAVRIAPLMGKTMTRAEVQARVQSHFATRDANRDGVLTADELQMRGNKRVMVLHRGDAPGAVRAMRDPNAAFDRLDANRDGAISRDEFARGREVRVERRVMTGKDGRPGAIDMDHGSMGQGKMGGMRGMRHGMGAMIGGGALLKLADTNRDGRVTLAEATSGALRHFDMMDSNRDGQLTPQEREAGRVHIRQMRTAG